MTRHAIAKWIFPIACVGFLAATEQRPQSTGAVGVDTRNRHRQ